MEFKYDTKPTYVAITPLANSLDANLTEALDKEITENAVNTNVLIDLQNCTEADSSSFAQLANLHEQCYNSERSLVFTGINTQISKALKESEIDMLLNIAPTQKEAIDIISMEILERDLFKED